MNRRKHWSGFDIVGWCKGYGTAVSCVVEEVYEAFRTSSSSLHSAEGFTPGWIAWLLLIER